VLVDLRKGSVALVSPWSAVLSDQELRLLYVPPGLAFGMYTLADNCSCFIKWDMAYHPQIRGVIRFDDPDLNIPWPLAGEPIISERDTKAITFKEFIKIKGSSVV